MKLTFAEFERRVAAEPPPDDGWQYWNCLLPDTAPRYFAWMVQKILHAWKARAVVVTIPPPTPPQEG